MCKLFPLMVLACLLFVPFDGHSQSIGNCGPNIISNAPECVARAVFEGADVDMPKGARYQIAITPVRTTDGKLVIPMTIPNAFKLMHEMLPHWYLNALQMSRGDNECDVIVNGWSYVTLIGAWITVNWHIDNEKSSLRRQFTNLGIVHNDGVSQALTFGFCEYVKHGEREAMKTIMKRAAWEKAHSPHGDNRG